MAYRAFHGFGANGRTGGPEAISSIKNQRVILIVFKI